MSSAPIRVNDFETVVFFTGAGMSAESGVPIYRGKGGIWKSYDYGSCACQEAFERNPEHVWSFHNYRRELVAACSPNAGHHRIATSEAGRSGITVVTQNIDGLHELAGTRSIHRLHGSLWHLRCDACGVKAANRDVPLTDRHCVCGAWWRPDIVWFGDALFPEVIEAVLETLLTCDLLVSIGTSAVVFPAAQMPLLAKKAGATLVEINPEPTPLSDHYDHCLRGTATEMLAALMPDP